MAALRAGRRGQASRIYEVASIHNERGYEKIRAALAHSYDVGASRPDIQVVDVDLLRRPASAAASTR